MVVAHFGLGQNQGSSVQCWEQTQALKNFPGLLYQFRPRTLSSAYSIKTFADAWPLHRHLVRPFLLLVPTILVPIWLVKSNASAVVWKAKKRGFFVLQQVLGIVHTPGNNKCKRFGGGAVHPWIGTNEKVPLDILVYRLVRNYLRSSSMKRAALKVSNLSPHYELWVLHTVHHNMYQVSHWRRYYCYKRLHTHVSTALQLDQAQNLSCKILGVRNGRTQFQFCTGFWQENYWRFHFFGITTGTIENIDGGRFGVLTCSVPSLGAKQEWACHIWKF